MSTRVISSKHHGVVSEGDIKQLMLAYRAEKNAAVDKDWKPTPGMVLTQVRAISARVNQNFDAWPSAELKKSAHTFVGKPVFVNHNNFDPTKARGKVVAARYIESGNDKYIEVIMETDAQRYPKLAKVLRDGSLDSVSMGVEAGFTICSACDNKSIDENDFFDHVRNKKGKTIRIKDAKTGKMKDQLVFEHCLVSGTLITMGDGTTRPVESIRVGDVVLDHLGAPRTVTQKMSREVDEDTFRIHRQSNQTQAPQMTGNHPVLAIRGGFFGNDTATRMGRLDRGLRPEFIDARELQIGDWVCEPHPSTDGSLHKICTADYTRQGRQHETCFEPLHTLPDHLELTEDLGRFVGLFLAEGSVNKALTQADFAFHRDEIELADFVERTARNLLGLTSITHNERNGGRTVTIFSSPLAQLLGHFGIGAPNKALPDEFMSAPIEFLRGVVTGHEDGDGLHVAKFVERHGHKHFTSSPKLAEQLYTLHVMLGNTPYHSTRQVRADYKYPGKNPSVWLPQHVVGHGNPGQKRVGRLSYGPWTFVRINSIDTIHYTGPVYNMEVADTHTYVAEGMAVHNCFKLGFFELSYVFDPADETAVVSRVMVAGKTATPTDDYPQWKAKHPEADDERGMPGRPERSPAQNGWLNRQKQRDKLISAAKDDDDDFMLDIDDQGEQMGGPDDTDYSQYDMPKDTGGSSNSWGLGGGGGSNGSKPASGGVADADGILPQSRGLYDSILKDHPGLDIGGYRVDNYHEHDSGALDVMTSDPAVAADVRQKAFDAGAPYVLWQQQQWNSNGTRTPMEDRGSPTQNHMDHVHTAPFTPRAASRRRAFGEREVPEDIDTLRNDENDTLDDYDFIDPIDINSGSEENPFEHYLESPAELSGPDLDRTKRLDQEQEADGLDQDRLVESIGDIKGDPDFEDAPSRRMSMGRKRRYANDQEALEELEELVGEDLDGDDEEGESDDHADAVYDDEGCDSDDDGECDDEESDDDIHVDIDGDGGTDAVVDQEGDDGEDGPPWAGNRAARRRSAKNRRRTRNKGQSQKGSAMSLTQRAKVATRGSRRHADNSGHTDGGPYGDNDSQGALEEVYLSQVPAAEAVAAPTGDGSKINNSEGNLVASIRAKSADLQREIRAYQSMKAAASAGSPYRASVDVIAAMPASQRKAAAEHMASSFKAANPRFSPRKFYAAIAQKLAEAPVEPKKVDPALSGTDEQGLKGDFDDVSLGTVETQPKDASKKVFAAFDAWIRSATGRTAAAHDPTWLRRQAVRWAQHKGLNVQALYPSLGNALRQARNTGSTTGKAAMSRFAEDQSLETAAPDARIDVEAPVKNDTDADAQASQYDLRDFAHNAGDQLADPELSSDSQIWVPDEGKTAKASGISAVRYAEACINAGLAPADDRWKLARQAETMRETVVKDRTALLERVASVNAERTRTAAVQTPRSAPIPRGLTAPVRTASTTRIAADDVANDAALFF